MEFLKKPEYKLWNLSARNNSEMLLGYGEGRDRRFRSVSTLSLPPNSSTMQSALKMPILSIAYDMAPLHYESLPLPQAPPPLRPLQ